jgi:Holliday junction resolvasome RuvABC endonuclease subunit
MFWDGLVEQYNVIGIDPGLQHTGYSYMVGGDLVHGRFSSGTKRGPKRLSHMRDEFDALLYGASYHMDGLDLIVYEDYSMGSRGNTFHIGELGGLYKTLAYDQGRDVLLVPPPSLKLFLGKGNLSKEQVRAAVLVQYGFAFETDDEADAFTLMAMGNLHRVGRARQAHKKRALEGCQFIRGKV